MKEIRRFVFQLILLLVALFVLYLLIAFVPVFQTPRPLRSLEVTALPNIRPTPETAAIARAPQSFQYLVSFTDRGFEPTSLIVKRGETVRFTNNTKKPLRLVGSDTPFASSEAVAPYEYIEITSDEIRQWSYADAATGKTGVIIIK